MTTPQLANAIALLSPFREPSSLDRRLHSELLPFTPEDLSSRGLVALASHDIVSGEEVLLEPPITLQHGAIKQQITWEESEELLAVAVLQLPVDTMRSLIRLLPEPSKDRYILSRYHWSHAGFTVSIQSHVHNGLFLEKGLINHDCAPK
jgi:hypothetical protein